MMLKQVANPVDLLPSYAMFVSLELHFIVEVLVWLEGSVAVDEGLQQGCH